MAQKPRYSGWRGYSSKPTRTMSAQPYDFQGQEPLEEPVEDDVDPEEDFQYTQPKPKQQKRKQPRQQPVYEENESELDEEEENMQQQAPPPAKRYNKPLPPPQWNGGFIRRCSICRKTGHNKSYHIPRGYKQPPTKLKYY